MATKQPLSVSSALPNNSRRVVIMAAVLAAALGAWPSVGLAALVQPRLLSAANYGAMAGSTITNTGSSVITGKLALSPGSALTGFPPGVVTGGTDVANGAAVQAQTDLTTAYNDAAGATPFIDMSGQDLGGKTLIPGAYRFSSSAQLTGTLTLDGQGSTNATFIFQIGSTLTTASGSRVVLLNGAGACAVFWQVTTSATLGTGTLFQGNILALSSITMTTGATLGGRALARNGALTLDTNTITAPPAACAFVAAAPPAPTATPTPTPTTSPTPAGLPNTGAASGPTPDGLPWIPIALAGLITGILVTSTVWRNRRRA